LGGEGRRGERNDGGSISSNRNKHEDIKTVETGFNKKKRGPSLTT
jgi:hypothetical protein